MSGDIEEKDESLHGYSTLFELFLQGENHRSSVLRRKTLCMRIMHSYTNTPPTAHLPPEEEEVSPLTGFQIILVEMSEEAWHLVLRAWCTACSSSRLSFS